MNIRNVLFNNKGLKVTAFLLAVLVWVLISGRERTYLEKDFRINIQHLNVADMIDVQNRPESIRIKARGTAEVIGRITESDFSVSIDLKGVKKRDRLTMYTEDHLKIPEGVEIISISPKIFEVTVRQFFHKEVAVRVLYTGRLPAGVALLERTLIPEKVTIFGYRSDIENIDTVFGKEKVDLSQVDRDMVIRISLDKPMEIFRFEGTDSVDVSLKVRNINDKRD